MKKLLLFLLFIGISFGQHPKDFESLIKRDGLYYLKFTNEPYSGPVFNIDGEEYNKGHIRDGKFDGVFTKYFHTGELREESIYRDGEGISYKSYWSNGQISESWLLKDRKLHGNLKSFYENGTIELEGKLSFGSGTLKEYDENGQYIGKWFLKDSIMSNNGEEIYSGTIKIYDENDKLVEEETYKDGELIDSKVY